VNGSNSHNKVKLWHWVAHMLAPLHATSPMQWISRPWMLRSRLSIRHHRSGATTACVAHNDNIIIIISTSNISC
jgi:hypothetical protein